MNRRDFCLSTPLLLAGCGVPNEEDMAQEYTLSPSPQRTAYAQTFGAGVRERWTPVFTFAAPGDLSVVYNLQSGNYIRIYNLVVAWFSVAMTTFTHTVVGSVVRITGLPFVSAYQETSEILVGVGNTDWRGVTAANYTQLIPEVYQGTSYIQFVLSGSAQGSFLMTSSQMPTGGTPAFIGMVAYLASE